MLDAASMQADLPLGRQRSGLGWKKEAAEKGKSK